MKSETRRPKAEGRPKSESRKHRSDGLNVALSEASLSTRIPAHTAPGRCARRAWVGPRSSDFGLRPSFGLRHSGFGFRCAVAPEAVAYTYLSPEPSSSFASFGVFGGQKMVVACPACEMVTGEAMSEFKFACPVCGQHITADSSTSGGQIECPTCFQKIVVPQAPASAETKFILSAAQVGKPRPASTNGTSLSESTPRARAMQPVTVIAAVLLVVCAAGAGDLLLPRPDQGRDRTWDRTVPGRSISRTRPSRRPTPWADFMAAALHVSMRRWMDRRLRCARGKQGHPLWALPFFFRAGSAGSSRAGRLRSPRPAAAGAARGPSVEK